MTPASLLHRSALSLALTLGVAVAAPSAQASEDLLLLQGGAFDLGEETSAEFGIAWRPDVTYWLLQPHAGVLGTTNGSVYGYGGVLMDLPLWESGFYLTPSVAVGLYGEGDDDHDLGGLVEFRTGLDLMYRFDGGWRVGVGFYHMSNAGLYDDNPGEEGVVLNVAVPLAAF